ncbi:MAG: hypothetical protein E6R03_04285 [Hyphomicrobiaceae bacterium]|nr:MAG: hypothetical protein E6R03_04285 [Hyphomicrobiaceae bacterium]
MEMSILLEMINTGQVIRSTDGNAFMSVTGKEVDTHLLNVAIECGYVMQLPSTSVGGASWIPSETGRCLFGAKSFRTRSELAYYAGLKVGTIRQYWEKRIPHCKVGNTTLFPNSSLVYFDKIRSGEQADVPPMPALIDTRLAAEMIGVSFPVLQKRMMQRLCYGYPVDGRGTVLWEQTAVEWLSKNMRWESRIARSVK